MAEELLKSLTACITSEEAQAIFLVGCTCLGAWIVFKWLLQVLAVTSTNLGVVIVVAFHAIIAAVCSIAQSFFMMICAATYVSLVLLCHLYNRNFSTPDIWDQILDTCSFFVFSYMWPFIFGAGFIMCSPTWRRFILIDVMPKYFMVIKGVAQKLIQTGHNTY